MRIEGDNVLFDSGRYIRANNGIIGIAPNLEVFEGYDGELGISHLTDEEKVELANYMISQWSLFRDGPGPILNIKDLSTEYYKEKMKIWALEESLFYTKLKEERKKDDI